MKTSQRALAGLGRIFISLIFILVGIASLFYWDLAQSELMGALANWEIKTGHIEGIGGFFNAMSSMVIVLMVLGITLQVIGGVLLFLGMKIRLGAFLLLIYMIPATTIYYHFWFLEGHALALSFALFLKNLAIIGGLLVVLAVGNGRFGSLKNVHIINETIEEEIDD
jgi:uncharacterized membrane protein YphA (DoxX/SURF4 family)